MSEEFVREQSLAIQFGHWTGSRLVKSANVAYLPVVYPGFGCRNLKGLQSAKDDIPRRGGDFYWRQFHAVANHKIDMAYVAMFDEVDEAMRFSK